jgi:hypothetical protein
MCTAPMTASWEPTYDIRVPQLDRPLSSLAATPATATVRGDDRRLLTTIGLAVGGVTFGLLAGSIVTSGKTLQVAGLAVVFIPVLLWKRPQFAPAILVAAAVLVEQVQAAGPGSDPLAAASGSTAADGLPAPITSSIPLFHGLGSLHLEPADLLLVMIALIYFARTAPATRHWPRSQLSQCVAALFGALLFGILVGLTHHGTLRVALMEVRPFVYLCATYVLTAVLIRGGSAIRSVLWALVVAAGLKALQALYVYVTEARHMQPRPQSIIGHEVAYIFAVFLFLVAALWLFQVPGRLRKTATSLLPLVITANLVNDRRAAWLLLGGGFLALAVIGYRALPSRRRKLRRIGFVVLAISAVYFPAYWNREGTLAQPARAIHSQFSPDTRDAASNLYRVQEDANLKYNIKQGGVLGKGFGVPIDYALPIVDISKIDPNIKYIPHNGVLYVPMRMGVLGAVALWAMIGAGILLGCRLSRSLNRETAVIGTVVACSLIAYGLEGGTDQGFYFDRIALVTGILLGLAEAARRLQRSGHLSGNTVAPEPSSGPAQSSETTSV